MPSIGCTLAASPTSSRCMLLGTTGTSSTSPTWRSLLASWHCCMSHSSASRISAANLGILHSGAWQVGAPKIRMPLKSIIKAALFVLLGASLAMVSGCGVDDVQLNGKVFDMVGLNGSGAKSGEPKLAVRQPLVVPPGLDSLPPPGSEKAAEPSLADIQDPDRLKKVSQAEQQKQQDDY